MRRNEVCAAVGDLVVLDNDETGNKRRQGGEVESCVYIGAKVFLRWGVRRLQDKDSLRDEEDARGVEELGKGVVSAREGRGEGRRMWCEWRYAPGGQRRG